ncbi:MAG: Rab family GTPase [Promethearchaeota archaeon]
MKKTVKIVVSGDGGVGKTCFLNRLIHDEFDINSDLTKGVGFFSKSVSVNGTEYNFIMWDFAGQNHFRSLLNSFVDGSVAAFILFDLTRLNTLETVYEWIRKISNYGKIPTLILGSKSDITNLNDYSYLNEYISEIRKYYKNIIGYFNISSKTGYNIKRVFDFLIENISD